MTLRKRAVKKVQLWLLRRISGGKSVVLNIRYRSGEIEVTRGGFVADSVFIGPAVAPSGYILREEEAL